MKRYIHSHWQNLNECRHCGEVCGPPWNGRAWRHIYPDTDAQGEPSGRPKVWHTEWDLFTRRKQFSLSLSVGGGDNEDEILFGIAVPFLFSLWVGAEGYIESRYKRGGERDISLRLDLGSDCGDWGCLTWRLWDNPNEWSRETPWWKYTYWDIADRLLGSQKYASEVVDEQRSICRFKEAAYPATVKEEFSTWTRPRFFGLRLPFAPFFRTRRSFEVTPDTPVPIPGKGENSWDCGDDAVYSLSASAESVDHAVYKFERSVLKTREKYGWKDPVQP